MVSGKMDNLCCSQPEASSAKIYIVGGTGEAGSEPSWPQLQAGVRWVGTSVIGSWLICQKQLLP